MNKTSEKNHLNENLSKKAGDKLNIIIAGGGIGGLSLACFLVKTPHIHCTIIERSEDVARSTAGAGIGLWHNSQLCLAQLTGVLEHLKSKSLEMPMPCYIDGATGKVLAKPAVGFSERFPVISLPRDEIMRTLLNYIEQNSHQIKIITGTQVLDYQESEETAQSVKVKLSNGQHLDADFLVAADGIHSKIRKKMLENWRKSVGERPSNQIVTPEFMGYAYFRAIININTENFQAASALQMNNWHQSSFEAWHQGRRFGYVPLKEPEVFWFIAIRLDDPILQPILHEIKDAHSSHRGAITQSVKDILEQAVKDWQAPVDIQSLIKNTATENIIRTDIHKIPNVSTFEWASQSGRVLLLGDAAHATAPNIAQGAGLSIEDAMDLAVRLQNFASSDLNKNTPTTTFQKISQAYIKARKPRAVAVQFFADAIAKAGQIRNPFLIKMRNACMRLGVVYCPDFAANFFERCVSWSLGGGSRQLAWVPPLLNSAPSHEIEKTHARNSLLAKVLPESQLSILPLHIKAFKTSMQELNGEGWVNVELGQSKIAHFLAKIFNLPPAMQKQPFSAHVKYNSEKTKQIWTRIFAAGTPQAVAYSTTHQAHTAPWLSTSAESVMTEGIGGVLDNWLRFAYRVKVVELATDLQKLKNLENLENIKNTENIKKIYALSYRSCGIYLAGLRLPLPDVLLAKSQWLETPTPEGWLFDGKITLPILGLLMHYQGEFKVNL